MFLVEPLKKCQNNIQAPITIIANAITIDINDGDNSIGLFNVLLKERVLLTILKRLIKINIKISERDEITKK